MKTYMARPYAAVAGIRQTKASEELYFRLKEELVWMFDGVC